MLISEFQTRKSQSVLLECVQVIENEKKKKIVVSELIIILSKTLIFPYVRIKEP